MKVLYVCPLAHETGHMPWAASHEPQYIPGDVTLLTFSGIRPGCDPGVPERRVLNSDKWLKLSARLRRYFLGQWVMRVADEWMTVLEAAKLGKSYDYIFLRDGEPFPFTPHLASIFHPGRKWIVSLTGGNFTTINSTRNYGRHKLLPIIYCALVNNRGWRLVYWLGHKLASFKYIVQDRQTKEHYEKLFPGMITEIPLGVEKGEVMSKEEARKILGIPQDKLVLLIFGVTHTGKRNEMVFEAVRNNPNTYLIHAGASYQSLGNFPGDLAKKYQIEGRSLIDDSFIPENKKPLYFGAADYVVCSYAKSFSSTSSVLWQAASFNRPVISSNANVLGELVRKHNLGVLFEAEHLKDLERAIIMADRMKEAYNGNATKFVKAYSMEAWGRKVNGLC